MRSETSIIASTTRRDACRLLLLVAAVLLVGGCAGDKAPRTTPLDFLVKADPEINVNERGVPSPVVVRIYELKSTTVFEQAGFFELLDADSSRLGADLVAKREFEMKPGDEITFERQTSVDTKYIGVIAGFREINNANWRSVAEVKAERNNSFVVQLTALSAKIELTRSTRTGLTGGSLF